MKKCFFKSWTVTKKMLCRYFYIIYFTQFLFFRKIILGCEFASSMSIHKFYGLCFFIFLWYTSHNTPKVLYEEYPFVTFISIEGIIKLFIFSNLIEEQWCLLLPIISNVIIKCKAAVLTLNNFLNNTDILYTLTFLVFFSLIFSFFDFFFLLSKTRSSPIAQVARNSLSLRQPLDSTSQG